MQSISVVILSKIMINLNRIVIGMSLCVLYKCVSKQTLLNSWFCCYRVDIVMTSSVQSPNKNLHPAMSVLFTKFYYV